MFNKFTKKKKLHFNEKWLKWSLLKTLFINLYIMKKIFLLLLILIAFSLFSSNSVASSSSSNPWALSPKIPKSCVSWYDWCNDCSVENWKILACTERACFRQDTPKCLKYKEESLNCTFEYSPRCWEKFWVKKTYWNKCELSAAKAKFLYMWKCKNKEEKCPIYNTLPAKKDCYYKYIENKNWCKIQKLICEKKYKYKLTQSLEERIKWVVTKFIQKLNNSKISNNAKIKKIENIIRNLKIISNKKPELKNIFDYLTELLEEEIVMLNINL